MAQGGHGVGHLNHFRARGGGFILKAANARRRVIERPLRLGQCGQPVLKCRARCLEVGIGGGIFRNQAGDFGVLGRQRRACGYKVGRQAFAQGGHVGKLCGQRVTVRLG